MRSALKALCKRYSKNLKVDKNVIFELLKATETENDFNGKNVVHIHVNELKVVEENQMWNSINISFIYVDGNMYNVNKNLLLIYYIAATHDKFTMDGLLRIVDEIERIMEHPWLDDLKENFLKCLGVNKNINEEIKLWLKLKQ
jgi:hypothetical protein